jgi:hypothetical protein
MFRDIANVKHKIYDYTGNDWNHLKIIQKIPEQRTGKARNQ